MGEGKCNKKQCFNNSAAQFIEPSVCQEHKSITPGQQRFSTITCTHTACESMKDSTSLPFYVIVYIIPKNKKEMVRYSAIRHYINFTIFRF